MTRKLFRACDESQGMTLREIAEVTGLGIKNVGYIVDTALRKLRGPRCRRRIARAREIAQELARLRDERTGNSPHHDIDADLEV
jgi:hypothetical protein